MKKSTLALAAVAVAGFSSAAIAQDVTFDLGTFTVTSDINGPLDDFTFNYSGMLDGFSFAGNFDDPEGGMWASDTRLQVYLDGVEVYNLGGFSGVINPWDFQGSGSANPGFYSHDGSANGVSGSGDWSFVFTNGWFSDFSNPIVWSDAELTLHNVPAPGALALLGLAGLVGSRRRRS